MAKQHVTTTINGEEAEYLCEPQETLLDVLRDAVGLTGTKEGCSSGDCGACSVMLDGRLVCSCLVLGVEAEGKAVEKAEDDAQYMKSRGDKWLWTMPLPCRGCTDKAIKEGAPDTHETRLPLSLYVDVNLKEPLDPAWEMIA